VNTTETLYRMVKGDPLSAAQEITRLRRTITEQQQSYANLYAAGVLILRECQAVTNAPEAFMQALARLKKELAL
jgi:hypothetical protein